MLGFGVMERGDKEGFRMARTRSEGHSIVLATKDGQTPSFPLPLLYLSPYGVAGDLLLLVIFQDHMWITLSRGGALEVSRASTSQCAHKV